MSVRTGVVIVSVGILACACSAAPQPSEPQPSEPQPSEPQPSEPRASPHPTIETSVPAALAPGVSWLRVSPEEGLRGATVTLDVACLDKLGAVHSPVLDVGVLAGDPAGHQPWHLTGTATVHFDAAPGRYPIYATCGADQLSAVFTVVPHP